MTAEDLEQAERDYQRKTADAEVFRQLRNAAVRRALESGWTHAQVADATGLTRSRVGQIALSR